MDASKIINHPYCDPAISADARVFEIVTMMIGAIVTIQPPTEVGSLIPYNQIPAVAARLVRKAMATGFAAHDVPIEEGTHRGTSVSMTRNDGYWRLDATRRRADCM